MNPPTLAGFISFLRNVVGITTTVLPDASPVIPMAYQVALDLVNLALSCTPIYALAVYNLGADRVLNFAQDLPNAAIIPGSVSPANPNGLAYFAFTRYKWNIFGFVSGVVQSTGDESTNVSMVVQEAAKNFTLGDMQNLKTPYGRQYLAFAQDYGPSVWGIN